MKNRAMIHIMKHNFPDSLDRYIDSLYQANENKFDRETFASLVGKEAIFGDKLYRFLKDEGISDTVENILNSVLFSKNNIENAKKINSSINDHIANKGIFGYKVLLEAMVVATTAPEIQASINKNGNIAKRLMVNLGAFLNLGQDSNADAVYADIHRSMSEESFERRNRHGEKPNSVGVANVQTSSQLTDSVLKVANSRGFKLSTALTRKFDDIRTKVISSVKNTLVASGIMATVVLGASAGKNDANFDVEKLIDHVQLEQAINEAHTNFIPFQEHLDISDLIEVDQAKIASYQSKYNELAVEMQESENSIFAEELENSLYESKYVTMYDSINAGQVVVSDGDSLWGISEDIVDALYGDFVAALTDAEYNNEVANVTASLIEKNNIENPDLIHIHQKIKIPNEYKQFLKTEINQRIDVLADKLEEKQGLKNTAKINF